jgi:hypothetical protein
MNVHILNCLVTKNNLTLIIQYEGLCIQFELMCLIVTDLSKQKLMKWGIIVEITSFEIIFKLHTSK